MLRKFVFGTVVLLTTLGFSQQAKAQAFEKGGTYLNLGLVGSNFWHINPSNDFYGGFYGSTVGGIGLQMEWGIHQYVGLGFNTGIQGGRRGLVGWHGPYYGGTGYGELAVPIGLIANFHFYQLIEDKTSKNIHGDKLDIYGGLNVGSGISFYPTPNRVFPLFFVGAQVGAKYYVTPTIGLGLELGYGKSFVNGGVTFKL